MMRSVLLVWFVSGCTERNPAYCEISERDCPGGYCDENHACVVLDAGVDGSGIDGGSCQPSISWISDRDGDGDIYIATASGSDTTALIEDDVDVAGFAWSPNGSQVAYLRPPAVDPEGTSTIWIAGRDGSNPRQLSAGTTLGGDELPVWSPDGREIAFFRGLFGFGGAVWVIDVESGAERNLSMGSSDCEAPGAWSPDGSRIAFIASNAGAGCLDFTNVRTMASSDGSGRANLTTDTGVTKSSQPRWSDDGLRVVFESARQSGYEIWDADADGGDLRNLTMSKAWEQWPHALSADTLLYLARPPDNGQGDSVMMRMSANGAGQTELGLSTEQVYAGSVRLSPERTRLVWTSARDGNLEIYAANVDGSGTVRLTSDPADDVSPSFRPCP